jgi:cysteine desulfurase
MLSIKRLATGARGNGVRNQIARGFSTVQNRQRPVTEHSSSSAVASALSGLATRKTSYPEATAIVPPAGSFVSDALKDAKLAEVASPGGVKPGRPIYLDMQATTPMDPRVLDYMMQFYTGLYGNPHSRTHAYGWETEHAVENARDHVASVIGADPKEIIFTSGATESNNMSLKGVARFYKKTKRHIITTQTEHKCVLDSCRHLQEEGFDVTYLPVKSNGLVDLEELEKSIRPDTAIVSIMFVNNEIGVIQPIEEIGRICRKHKVFFHTDAAQAYGKVPIDVNKLNIDLMSISGHKIYGPKGVGACYVRRRPRVRLEPLINGGGQERGLRSGTLAPALVAGFGEACRLMKSEMEVCMGMIEIFETGDDDLIY